MLLHSQKDTQYSVQNEHGSRSSDDQSKHYSLRTHCLLRTLRNTPCSMNIPLYYSVREDKSSHPMQP